MVKPLQKLLSFLLAFVMLFTSSFVHPPQSYAADDSINFVNVGVTLANDNDGNNVANIGDVIMIIAVLNNADGGCVAQTTQVTANLTAYGGGAAVNIPCTTDNGGVGDIFDIGFNIVNAAGAGIDVPANDAASQIQVTATDADENNGAGNPNPTQQTNPLGDGVIDTTATNGVDTTGPVITDANISAGITTDANTPGVAEVGDIITVNWDNSGGGDNNPDINPGTVQVDLSQFGGPNNQVMNDGGGVFSFAYTIVDGVINASNLNATVSAEDDAQNSAGTADTSNLSVDNLTSFGGARRSRAEAGALANPVLFDSTAYFPSFVPDDVSSCGCGDAYGRVYGMHFDATLNTGLGLDSSGIMCMNPVCIDPIGQVITSDTPAEKAYREAFRKKLDAGKAYSDTQQQVIDAEKAYNEAEGDFQNERLNQYEGTGSRAAYNRKKKARDAAWANLRDAKERHNDAKNDYNQANWEFQKMDEDNDLLDPERRRQIIEEELSGGPKTVELFSNDNTPTFFSCFDFSCGGSVDPLDTEAWNQATTELNICLEECGTSNNNLTRFEYDSNENVVRNPRDVDGAEGLDGETRNLFDERDLLFKPYSIDDFLYDDDTESILRSLATEEDADTKYEYDNAGGTVCEKPYSQLSEHVDLIVTDFFFDPNQFECFNPSCFNLLEYDVHAGDTPAESAFRQGFRDKLDAGKKLQDAMDATRRAQKAYDEAEGDFQDARIDRSQGKGSQGVYDEKKAARDKAWDDLRAAEKAENDAKNDYNQAYWEYKELDEDSVDLLGLETRNRIIREEMNGGQPEVTITDIGLSCYDPVCGVSSGSTFPAQGILDGFEAYDHCLRTGGSVDPLDTTTGSFDQYEYDDSRSPVILDEKGHASDIDTSPEYDSISRLYDEGVLNGVGGSHEFKPEDNIRWAPFLKIVVRTPGEFVVPGLVKINNPPLPGIDPKVWYAPYYFVGAQEGIVTKAQPDAYVNLAEALTVATRTFKVDTSGSRHYDTPSFLVGKDADWWHGVATWAVGNGVIEDKKETTGYQRITRAQAADIMVKVRSASKWKKPCNCDKEKAAVEKAEAEADAAAQQAKDSQDAADASQKAADASEATAKDAADVAKEANDKVSDLLKFFDDSSSVTNEDGETITTGDLHLLREVNRGIFNAWAAGDISAEEASEAWEGNNKDKLDELRAKKADELKDARAEADKANADAEAKRATADADQKKADADQAQADADQEASEKADKALADARTALAECEKRCAIINAREAERRKKAAAAARAAAKKKAEEAKKKRDAQRKRDAERARQQAEDEARRTEINNPSTSSGGGGGGEQTPPPVLSDADRCKQKLAEAIAARGKQIAKTRPGDPVEVPDVGKTPRTVAAGIGKMIASAANAAIKGADTTLQIAKAVSSTLPAVYKLWVDYVGEAIKGAGTRIINNRRICQVIKHSTSGKWGYETFPPGQVVYWEKDANGNYQVIVMGPGDNVTTGQCQ